MRQGAEEAAALREHLRACAQCRATVRAYRAAPAAVAALAPVLPLGRSFLDRAHDALAALAGRFGGGAASDSTLSQVAVAGGSRGAGTVALAKAIGLCVGAAGGAAACAATGVIPVPFAIERDQAAPQSSGRSSRRPSRRRRSATNRNPSLPPRRPRPEQRAIDLNPLPSPRRTAHRPRPAARSNTRRRRLPRCRPRALPNRPAATRPGSSGRERSAVCRRWPLRLPRSGARLRRPPQVRPSRRASRTCASPAARRAGTRSTTSGSNWTAPPASRRHRRSTTWSETQPERSSSPLAGSPERSR